MRKDRDSFTPLQYPALSTIQGDLSVTNIPPNHGAGYLANPDSGSPQEVTGLEARSVIIEWRHQSDNLIPGKALHRKSYRAESDQDAPFIQISNSDQCLT